MKSSFQRGMGVALLAVLLAGCSKPSSEKTAQPAEREVPITTAVVESVSMDQTLPIVGTLFAKDEATIAAQVDGQIERTRVDFGDRITNGQEIASIDTASYEALAAQSAAKVTKARANLVNAQRNLKRIQSLAGEKISSPSDLDKAGADAEEAEADLKSAEADDAMAQLNLKRSRVVAPFDAAVADRIGNAGDYVKTGASLFRVVNDTVLKYIVQAPESYAGKIEKKQLVTLTVDAWPGETFQGGVYLISPQVNTATRGFAFGALIQNPDGKLKANTFARGEVTLAKNVETSVVPLDAVMNFAGVTKVFVVDNGVAHARDVQVGRIKDGQEEILAGLKPGEVVATSGQSKLTEGAKVRTREVVAKAK